MLRYPAKLRNNPKPRLPRLPILQLFQKSIAHLSGEAIPACICKFSKKWLGLVDELLDRERRNVVGTSVNGKFDVAITGFIDTFSTNAKT